MEREGLDFGVQLTEEELETVTGGGDPPDVTTGLVAFAISVVCAARQAAP